VKRFTVAWHDDVAEQLATLVVKHWGAPLGQQISEAANAVDRELSSNPQAQGHALAENVQLVVVGPLAVEYAIFDEDRQVTLLNYHLCPARS
jgi:hypothetical protein